MPDAATVPPRPLPEAEELVELIDAVETCILLSDPEAAHIMLRSFFERYGVYRHLYADIEMREQVLRTAVSWLEERGSDLPVIEFFQLDAEHHALILVARQEDEDAMIEELMRGQNLDRWVGGGDPPPPEEYASYARWFFDHNM
jgi:hypothetical protein